MKYLILIFVLIASLFARSQSVSKVLLIDTLVSADTSIHLCVNIPLAPELFERFESYDSLDRNFILGNRCIKKLSSAKINFKHSPAAVFVVSSPLTSSDIELPLDDSGGVLTVKGAFLLKADTIRINKYSVVHNCLADTVKSKILWYKNYNSDTSRHLKLLRAEYAPDRPIARNCNDTFPTRVPIVIDNKEYIIIPRPHDINSQGNALLYHGHKKMNRRQERRWKTAGQTANLTYTSTDAYTRKSIAC